MKRILTLILLLATTVVSWAYDIAVENSDGVTIYYNYFNDGKELEVTYTNYKSYRGSIVIPDEVTYESKSLKVTSIGERAFSGCTSLTSVTIPNSVTSIGERAFSACYSMTSVTIPNSVTSIGDAAFNNCGSLTSVTIPNSMTSIGNNTFQDCRSLTSVMIPNSVTSIGGFAFYGCSSLISVTIPNSVTSIGDVAFRYCTSLTSVTIPNSVTSIGNAAFSDCTSLTSVTIPNSVTSIGGFSDCTSLTSINIPNSVTSIEGGAFSNCSSLTSITIPGSVTSIGNLAFEGCTALKELIVEESDQVLLFVQEKITPTYSPKKLNFDECPLESVYIGRNYNYTSYCPFKEMQTISSIEFGNKVTKVGAEDFYDCKSLTLIKWGSNISEIGNFAFCGANGIESITIPNTISVIGRGAFLNCNSLKSIIIEDGVTPLTFTVDFNDCNCFGGAFKSVYLGRNINCHFSPFQSSVPYDLTIGKNVSLIGRGAFVKQTGILTLSFEEGNDSLKCDKMYNARYSFMPFKDTPIDSIYLGRYIYGTDDYNLSQNPSPFEGVPSSFSLTIGHNIKEIANGVFENSKINRLSIPANIEKIATSTFQGCNYLTSISVEDGEKPLNYDDGCNFIGCPLDSVYLGRNISCPENSGPFSGNKEGLSKLTIGAKVTEIKDNAFSGHKGITHLQLSEGLKKIGLMAFYGCKGLTSITIPESVEEIGNEAFNMCTNLSYLHIEDGTKELLFTRENENKVINTFSSSPLKEIYIGRNISYQGGVSPFMGNDALTILRFGKNVTNIQERSYIACSNIANVYCYPANVPNSGEYIFTDSYLPNAILHTPVSSFKNYMKSDPWNKFGKRFVIMEDGQEKEAFIVTYLLDGVEYLSDYELQGNILTAPDVPTKEGYTFSGWEGLPDYMPAHDVTVTGGFTINSYKLTYVIDGVEFKTEEVEFGSTIVAETPTKEGYTFTWTDLPETMPAHDVTVTGSFSINTYKITYVVDGKEYGTSEVVYGAEVNPISEPTKEGYTFSGWEGLPDYMPAKDVTVTGTFLVNKYKVTFMYGDNVLTTIEVNYGAAIELPTSLNSERYTLVEWLDVPETMPAHDLIIYADYVDGINTITADSKDEQYIRISGMYTNDLKKGVNIIRTQDGKTRKVWVK